MSRRLLLIVLIALGCVPVATGLWAVITGPAGAPGGAATVVSVDNEYRFVNVVWMSAGLLLLWSLRRAGERALVTRVILVVAAAGAIGRIVSVALNGWPHPVFIATLGLELIVVPLVIWWHSRVFPVARAASASK